MTVKNSSIVMGLLLGGIALSNNSFADRTITYTGLENQQKGPSEIKAQQDKPKGLLLPAVQSVREAANRNGTTPQHGPVITVKPKGDKEKNKKITHKPEEGVEPDEIDRR